MYGRSAGFYSFLAIFLISSVLILSNAAATEKTIDDKNEGQKDFIGPDAGIVIRMEPASSSSSSRAQARPRVPEVSPRPAGSDDLATKTARAQAVIASNKNAVGIDEKNIRLTSVDYDEPAYASQRSGASYVFYGQTYNNVPVYGSYVGLVSIDGKDVLLKSNVYPGISIETTPSISADKAITFAQTNLGTDAEPLNYSLIIFPVNYGKKDYRLAWKIQFSMSNPQAAWEMFVDAQKGEIIYRKNMILDSSVSGQVNGFIYPDNPSSPKAMANFSGLNVSASQNGGIVGSAITDLNGSYNITGLSGDVHISSELKGPFVNVINADRPKSNHSVPVASPSVHNWNWSINDTSYKQEESNVFYHINRVHDFVTKGSPFDISQMNYQATANVEYGSSSCNAFANMIAGSVNFFGPGGGCESTALGSDVIYHEYSHIIVDRVMDIISGAPGENGGSMHEGIADYFAATLRNDSVIGLGIFPEPIRFLNNTLKMPEDFTDEIHDDGRIIAGALWDLRGLLGNSTTDNLTIRTMKMKGQTFTQFLADMFIADDDNADLTDGTPHINEICRAFHTNHKISSSNCPVTPIYGKAGDKIYLFENNTPIIINDYPSPGNFSSITVPGQLSGNVSNVSVFVGINHTYIGDLKVQLQSPSGKSIFLHYLTGDATGDLFTWYGNETLPATQEGLHQFINEPANGTWMLKVGDYAEVDIGNITKWKLLLALDMPNAPAWSLNNSYLHKIYGSGQNYSFQIRWNDTDNSGPSTMSQAIFELNSLNYTGYSSPAVTNDSQGIFWINLTDLSAGSYSYKWYASNTINVWNYTAQLPFSIARQPTNTTLLLNGSMGDFKYDIPTFANFTVFVNVTGKNVTLTANISGWLDQNATTVLFNITLLQRAGIYNITAYFAGDQNYSASSQTHFATAADVHAPLVLGNFSLPESGTEYYPGRNYTFNASIMDESGISKVILQFDSSNYTATFFVPATTPSVGILSDAGVPTEPGNTIGVPSSGGGSPGGGSSGPSAIRSGNWSVTITDLAANATGHEIIWYVNDTFNNWNKTDAINYVIKKNTSAYTIIKLNKTPSEGTDTFDFEVGEPFHIYVSASDPAIAFNIYENISTLDTPEFILSQNGVIEGDTHMSSGGGYHVWTNSSENENYTANNTLEHILIRAKDTIKPKLTEYIIAPRSIKKNSNVTFMTISEDYSSIDAFANIYNKTNPSVMQMRMDLIIWKGNEKMTHATTFNSSVLDTGTFSVNVSLTDAGGNSVNHSIGNITVSDSVGSAYYSNTHLPVEEKIEIDLSSELNISLNISSSASGSSDSIVLSSYNTNPSNENTNGFDINKFTEISAGSFLSDALNWVEMRMFYSSSDIPAGYDENNLRIYYNHPNGTWLPYDGPILGGANTTENFVWANSTHFSLYGLFVMPTCNDGIKNQDETATDCGGICSACAPPAPAAPSPGGGGGGSSITTTTSTTTTTITTTTTTTITVVYVQTNNKTVDANATKINSDAANLTGTKTNLDNGLTGAATARANNYTVPMAVIGSVLVIAIIFTKLTGNKKSARKKSTRKKSKLK